MKLENKGQALDLKFRNIECSKMTEEDIQKGSDTIIDSAIEWLLSKADSTKKKRNL